MEAQGSGCEWPFVAPAWTSQLRRLGSLEWDAADRWQLVEMGVPRTFWAGTGRAIQDVLAPQGAPSKYPVLLGPLPHGDSDLGENALWQQVTLSTPIPHGDADSRLRDGP